MKMDIKVNMRMSILMAEMIVNTKMDMKVRMISMNTPKVRMTRNTLKMNMLKLGMMMNLMMGAECIQKIWVLQLRRLVPVILLGSSWLVL